MSTKSYQSFNIKYKGASTLIIKKKLTFEKKKNIIILMGFILGFILILLLDHFCNIKDMNIMRWVSISGILLYTYYIYYFLKPQYFVFDKIKDQFKAQNRVLQKLSEVKFIEIEAYPEVDNPHICRLYIVGPYEYIYHWMDISTEREELMVLAETISKFLGVPVVKVENEKK